MGLPTPGEVLAGYRKTGLKPARRKFYRDGLACGLVAGVAAREPDGWEKIACEGSDGLAEFFGVTEDEVWAFTDGFDGNSVAHYASDVDEAFDLGRKAAFAAFGSSKGA